MILVATRFFVKDVSVSSKKMAADAPAAEMTGASVAYVHQ
jgi:hypothetical protein